VRNQFGTRFGGPVKHNKTFFNGIWEEDHENQRVATNSEVFTPTALQGIYRYFPGALNENATGVAPVVNTSGVPIEPSTASGPLQSISVFNRDPNRPGPDSTGAVAKMLALMPAPNNYLVGDGLNTAGYLWSRPVVDDFQLFEGRVDHIFNEKHRATITLNHQSYYSENVAAAQPFPDSPVGLAPTETTQYSASLTSSLRPHLLNEIRIGVFRPRVLVFSDYDPLAGPSGVAGEKLLPTSDGTPFYLGFATAGLTNPLAPAATSTGTTSNRISQTYQYGDDLTWIKGKHTFKVGFVTRFINNAGYDTVGTVPTATVGAGNVAVQNISNIAGIGSNSTGAQNLLLDLSGSLSSASQVLNSPGGANPQFIAGETRYSNLLSHEYSSYFKDDWKIKPNLTLNLGVRWEYYGVPVDGDGRMQAPIGGGGGIFGISGTNFGSLFTPGASSGQLTTVQLIGPETPNPNTHLFNSSPHNFGPAVGFAWALGEDAPHWLSGGKGKTVIRSGYGISYIRTQLYVYHMYNSYEPDALTTTVTESTAAMLDLANVKFPIPNTQTPLFTEPLNGLRTQAVYSFQNNLATPYAQNFNFSIQREFSQNTHLTVSYVGDVGDKLLRAYDVNEVNLLGQGSDGETFLSAFETVRAGGDSKFMDQLVAPLGLTSALMRSGSAFSSIFQPMFANNNPAELAAALSASLVGSSLGSLISPSAPGGVLLTKAGLPQNFFVVNPQFAIFPLGTSAVFPGGAYTVDNSGHSDYHSLQVVLERRLSHGFSYQGSYVFSKVLGDSAAGESAVYFADYRTLRDEALDKGILSFNHAGVVKINGIYEFPFGPGKPWLSHGFLSHVLGGWQSGAIFTYFTGAPLTLTGTNGWNNSDANGAATVSGIVMQSTATQVGPLPASVTRVGNGIQYFPGATLVTDPQVATLASSLQPLSALKAVAINGQTVLENATPGSLGALGYATVNGPPGVRLDFNLLKRFHLTERFVMEFRATAENLTNTEVFGTPQTNINSSTFGHITATATGFTPRIIVAQLRLSF
jgi:TonB dependent receptor